MAREQLLETGHRLRPDGHGLIPAAGLLEARRRPRQRLDGRRVGRGARRIPEHGQLILAIELRGADIAVSLEESPLDLQRLVEFGGRGLRPAFRDQPPALGLEFARPSPEGFRLQTAEPRVEPGQAPRVGQARIDPLFGDLLLEGRRPADLGGGLLRVGFGRFQGGRLQLIGQAPELLGAQGVVATTEVVQAPVILTQGAPGRDVILLGLQGLGEQADILLGQLGPGQADLLESRLLLHGEQAELLHVLQGQGGPRRTPAGQAVRLGDKVKAADGQAAAGDDPERPTEARPGSPVRLSPGGGSGRDVFRRGLVRSGGHDLPRTLSLAVCRL